MPIPFTQFMRPDGRKHPVTIERPPDIETLAKAIMQAGCRFEIEVLQTGAVSMEIVTDVPDPDLRNVVAIEICPNGPQVPEAVDRLVKSAVSTLKLNETKDQKQ